jgi:mRNA interferase MazF
VVVERGTIWWAELPEPRGAEPGYRRPVVVVQSDAFNRSRIATVLVVALSSNLGLLDAPGNVLVPARASGLTQDSVANVSQVLTLDRAFLTEQVGKVPPAALKAIADGLRLVLAL